MQKPQGAAPLGGSYPIPKQAGTIQVMKLVLAFLLGVLLGLTAVLLVKWPDAAPRVASGDSLSRQVYFSPRGGCAQAIIDALDGAQGTVRVQAYSFTSAPIAKALTDAKKRGVQVEAILDKSNNTDKYSAATFLLHASIPTYIDAEHAIAHNKVIIVDDHTVITGSFNFSRAAEERNAENLLVLRDRALAARYLENWHAHKSHSTEYKRPE
jgi:phosphatidylserine/phosphatidylglycerophosphate/cardiolipin synthase-like enzyme